MSETSSNVDRSAAETDRGKGSDFYRDPRRVAILMFIAPFFYWFWWLWQVFKFTRRERFPHARNFWWILVPFYGVYLLYQQFDDIKLAAKKVSGHSLNSVLAGWLAFIGLYSGGGSNRAPAWVDLILVMISGLALSIAAFLVQRAANAYVAEKYPAEKPRPMTPGEMVVAVLGILVLALFVVGVALPPSA